MKKMLFILIAAAIATPALAFPTFTLYGTQFETTAKVKLSGNGGGSGGSFVITVQEGELELPTGWEYEAGDSFTTFCIEKDKHASFTTYYASVDLKAYSGDTNPAGDPISNVSEVIYEKWLQGDFAKDKATQTAISNAIWFAEGEIDSISGLSKDIYDAAVAQVGTIGDAEKTFALNLWAVSDTYKSGYEQAVDGAGNTIYVKDIQSQLITVPAPGAVILSSLGTVLVGWVRRRNVK